MAAPEDDVPSTEITPENIVEEIATKSLPFQAIKVLAPAETETPVVGPEPRTTIAPVPALITM